jgi:hypothetical protein
MSLITMNNEAVALLCQGKHGEALNMFRQSLNSIRDHVGDAVMEEEDGAPPAAPPLRSVPIASGLDDDSSSSAHNLFCFYNRAFELPGETGTATFSLSEQMDFSKVILFNMGLTLHHKGLVSTTGGEKTTTQYLLKALAIYKTIVSLQGKEASSSSFTNVLLMAVYSNMGHIYSHFFDRQEAMQCRYMIKEMMFRSASRENMSSDEYVVFFLNTDATSSLKMDWAPAA